MLTDRTQHPLVLGREVLETVPDRHPARPGHHERGHQLPHTTHHITPQAGHPLSSPTSSSRQGHPFGPRTPVPTPTNPPTNSLPHTTTHFSSVNREQLATPRLWAEVHPSHGFRNGEPVRVVTRRGSEVFPALVTEAIRPDTAFIPYHWPIPTAANALTIDALDPRSKIPEYNVYACRIEHAEKIDEAPAPPVAPGQVAYPEAQVSRTDPLPRTAPQGRGTSERS
nr:hypothetical protein OG781_22060 [Streptomyces sp. NBC_00830]